MKDNPLSGKRLLVLGCTPNEMSLVRRAQSYGVCVIVTDYNLDYNLSPVKRIADEAWDVSWSDIDALEEKCKETRVDGVMAGYSEFRVESMLKLCKRLHLPCYIDDRQLEITRDKIKFKNECRVCDVPVVRDFDSPNMVNCFPVIVKPVDRAGSIGIGIANDRVTLEKVYQEALAVSTSDTAIIEEFMGEQKKFDAFYCVIDGEIIFLSTDDVVNSASNGLKRVVQSAWLLPSKYQDNFCGSEADIALRRLITRLDIRDGYIFFSGFADGKSFKFFECGFRLCGSNLFEYLRLLGKPDTLDLHIYHALTGSSSLARAEADARRGDAELKQVTINVYSNPGTVSIIEGFEEIEKLPDCVFSVKQGYVGEQCQGGKAILDKMGMFYFVNRNAMSLSADVEKAYSFLRIEDDSGADLIHDRIDSTIVETWWGA